MPKTTAEGENLRNAFTTEQLELAAAIGTGEGTVQEKIAQTFATLSDPLLAVSDVTQLLGGKDPAEIETGLAQLCEQGILEVSTTTLRPLDPAGIALYRQAGVSPSRLKLLALEVDLGDGTTRFQFTCDGRLIRSLAVV